MNTKLTEFRTARKAPPLLAFAGTKKPGASPGFGVLVERMRIELTTSALRTRRSPS